MTRRNTLRMLGGLAWAAACSASPASAQEAFPSKPVRVIVPLPAGGTADIGVRVLAEHFQGLTKQPMTVDNRPGGIFVVGMQAATQAPADGYTLIHLNIGMVTAQVVNNRFDMLKQLVPVALMGTTDGVLVASPSAPFKTFKEFLDWTRANPGKLNYGSAGPGSIEHLSMAHMLKRYGLTGTHVPFKGGPDAMTALAQGEIHVFATAVPLVLQFMQKNLARPLALMVDKRSPVMPEVPTLKELGADVPNLVFWGGLAAPAGTPKSVVEALQTHIAASLKNPGLQTRYTGLGMVTHMGATDEFARMIQADLKWMAQAVQDLDLKAQ